MLCISLHVLTQSHTPVGSGWVPEHWAAGGTGTRPLRLSLESQIFGKASLTSSPQMNTGARVPALINPAAPGTAPAPPCGPLPAPAPVRPRHGRALGAPSPRRQPRSVLHADRRGPGKAQTGAKHRGEPRRGAPCLPPLPPGRPRGAAVGQPGWDARCCLNSAPRTEGLKHAEK